jgi:hypothetical protein
LKLGLSEVVLAQAIHGLLRSRAATIAVGD